MSNQGQWWDFKTAIADFWMRFKNIEENGSFNNYIDRFLDFFDHPPTPRGQGK